VVRKLALCLLASAALAIALGGCRRRVSPGGYPTYGGRPGYAPQQPAPSMGWSRVSPDVGGVSIEVPSRQPARQSHTERAEDGARRYVSSVSVENRAGLFGLLVVRWEGGIVGDPLPAASELARSIFERAEIPRDSSRRVTRNGFYGREDTGSNDGGAFVRLQQFIGSDRVVLAVAIIARDSPPAQQMAERFLGSLQLDPRHALFAAPGTQRSDGGWTPLYIPESDFGIRMPAAPSVQEQELRIAARPVTVSMFQSTDDWGTYLVRVITFPQGGVPDEAFEEVRRRLNLQDRVRFVQSSGYPGWVYTTDADGRRTLARVFLTGSRIYVVTAQGPMQGLRQRPIQRRILSYFDSFRIL